MINKILNESPAFPYGNPGKFANQPISDRKKIRSLLIALENMQMQTRFATSNPSKIDGGHVENLLYAAQAIVREVKDILDDM
jgi:hypothetical protein